MNGPQYLISKVVTRASFNFGRVVKEVGLCKYSFTHFPFTNNPTMLKKRIINIIIIIVDLDRAGSRLSNDIAYTQELSRHRQLLNIYDSKPEIDSAWIAPNATIGNSFPILRVLCSWRCDNKQVGVCVVQCDYQS